MNKAVLVIFGLLTAGSIALSSSHFGATGATVQRPDLSVRQGSVSRGLGGGFVGGGGSRTK